jgi:hypothetical protein
MEIGDDEKRAWIHGGANLPAAAGGDNPGGRPRL